METSIFPITDLMITTFVKFFSEILLLTKLYINPLKVIIQSLKIKGSHMKIENNLWCCLLKRYDPCIMARPYRLQSEDCFYHITSRGNDKKKIFLNDTDFEKFLDI